MKVLFIYPNSGAQIGFNYGVASLASELKASGHGVEFWQLCEDIAPLPTREEVWARVRESRPDFIGFSVVTNQWPLAEQVARWCREACDAPIGCGGIHATVAADEVLAGGVFDYVFAGECEGVLSEFLDRLASGRSVTDLSNLGYRRDGDLVMNPVRPLPALRTLPPKDYEIFDFQKIIDAKNGWVGLMASRGCPFNCTYCFNHLMVKKYRKDLGCSFRDLNYIRHHSVSQMIDEIRFLEKQYRNITMYIFDDDLFTFDKDFVMEFCDAYKKASRMPFVVNGHVGLWDDDRARVLSEAGCRIVKFGVESGSEKIRRQIMHRNMSNDKITEAIATVHRYGMHSSCFIMFGLPYETREDAMDTIGLMARALPGRYRWTFFYPFPGTESYAMSEEGGFIHHGKSKSLVNFTDASCLDFGHEQNLFLAKVGKILPWFVNAYSELEVAPFYGNQVETILAMNEEEWLEMAPRLDELDRQFSRRFAAEGKRHYAIKYNRFMGVISDYFLQES